EESESSKVFRLLLLLLEDELGRFRDNSEAGDGIEACCCCWHCCTTVDNGGGDEAILALTFD
uniref:Uncharacterized protein n=1 Tax=Panagrolaimus sp. PS1159 TaxID=55785 RepID=A0AC35GY32_9BILA